METKSYFASSVPAALEIARRELGPEALLVGSRPAPPENRQFGRLEVTFAWNQRPDMSRSDVHGSLAGGRQGRGTEHALNVQSSSAEIEDIRRQIKALRTVVGRAATAVKGPDILERLTTAGLDPHLTSELIAEAGSLTGDPEARLVGLLEKHIHVAPFAPLRSGENRTLAFVGPPGRGKSTSLVKFALSRALANRTPVRIYTAGPHAVGDSDKMARYCSVLGVPHQTIESIPSLELALRGEAWNGFTLIDTPGLSPSDHCITTALGEFLHRRREIETHLVLRAESQYADMLAATERFASLRAGRLLFVGTDETSNYSAMVNLIVRTAIPVTFEGTGPSIPEDFVDADAASLAGRVLAQRGQAAAPKVRRAVAA